MANIDIFDKGLHGSRSLFDLLLGHAAYDLAGTTGDSCDKDVGELFVIGSFVEGFDDYGFFSCVTSCEDDYYLSTLCEDRGGGRVV
jgi:hypothetical protein